MLGVEGYGSDNDSDNEQQTQTTTNQPAPALASKLPPPSKKSTFSLPPPTSSSNKARTAPGPSSSSSLPAQKTKRPKKIAIGLPALPPEDHEKDDSEDHPAAKKPRLESGAGASALLSMLPAPKNKAPVAPVQERVLGGGRGPGLVFHTGSTRTTRTTQVEDAEDEEALEKSDIISDTTGPILLDKKESLPFLPPSLVKGKANISLEEKHAPPKLPALRSSQPSAPGGDFFSLGSASATPSPPPRAAPPASNPLTATSSAPSVPFIPSLSSAPKVDEFVPPEPTPQDPYPGYYMLPSGAWAAHDPEYYRTFYDKWKREYDAHVRALEKGAAKGFEDVETQGAHEVNAQAEMERAKIEIQEREERKALTKGGADAPVAPKMNIKVEFSAFATCTFHLRVLQGAALGGRARTRHQLSTLLTEAYQNREALEEQIAQGRRNRKEAGNKYGESHPPLSTTPHS
ncbi:hypothetical protein CERSUDRAFT_72887 [Gelatoporia subvermispora B]|uniref:Mitotic checkpoint regulator, MAD2B-interacting-domain-containing protein n=1 Tax=Ceriporiopsis subvermispora (strain B) TaxID=914234 RepID=M2PPE7_CERS8|nr:hypothetical protein CERSUDRAFT_72887 [Gelatoporia subvermispora B]